MTHTEHGSDMLPLAVVADDLTGAMDSGLQFALQRWETLVELVPGDASGSPVLAVSTESRDLPASAAVEQIRALMPRLAGRRVFKKIDSTLRGNVGYELRAMLSALSIRAAVVAPAFPQGGRTTVHGEQHVDGVPLSLTAFRDDPRWPMRESHVATYLMQQSGTEVENISLATVAEGPDAIVRALTAGRTRLVVADAVTDAHLSHIAQAIYALGPAWMPCGSAGLAQAWASLLGAGTRPPFQSVQCTGRGLLFVVGSRNPATGAQVEALLGGSATRVALQSQGSYDPGSEIERLAQAVCTSLENGRDTVLEASSAPLVPGGGPRVADILARTARIAVSRDLVNGLFLTGGEIALATCRALDVRALRIMDAIEPGIPGGQLVGGPCDGLPAVTKAGGFGSPQALLAAQRWLRNVLASPHGDDDQEEAI